MRRVVAGIGCRLQCPADAIVALVRKAIAASGQKPTILATAAFKADESGLREAAIRLGLELILITPAALAEAQPRCVTRSTHAEQAVGVASVAEGSALAAAGPDSRLILARIASDGATCALAGVP